MKVFWGRIGEKLNIIWQWCYENHPGKLFGSLIGFMIAFSIIMLGFWQTVLLFALTASGFFIGKFWDEGEFPPWVYKILHRISFWSKN